MNDIRQVHIHHFSDTVIINVPFGWESFVSNSSCSFLAVVRLGSVGHFGWSWASSVWCATASSLSLFFVISVCSVISGWFVLKTIGINRIVCTFYFFPRNDLVVLIFAIFTFSLIFACGCTSANRWSLWPFWSRDIRIFFSVGFWSRYDIFLSSSLISLVASFTWNSSFWSWSFSTFFSFFNGFILFRGTFASVWFS